MGMWAVIEGDGDVVSGNEDAGEGDSGVFGEIGRRVAGVVAQCWAIYGRGAVILV